MGTLTNLRDLSLRKNQLNNIKDLNIYDVKAVVKYCQSSKNERLENFRIEEERLEQEKIEREKLEQQKIEREKLEQEKFENDSLLRKFEKVMRMSTQISKSDAATMMDISESDLLKHLFEWGDHLSFKINGNMIVVENMDKFLDDLDVQFTSWESKEFSGEGKI